MVLIHLKRTEEHQFLYEAPAATEVDALTGALVELYNERLRVCRLCAEAAELAAHGPARPPGEQGLEAGVSGLTLTELDAEGRPAEGGSEPPAARDPTGRRVGVPPPDAAQRTLRRTIDDALAAIHKRQVEAKVPLTAALLAEHLSLIRGAVTICYPGGLPAWDPVAAELAGEAPSGGEAGARELVPLAGATLWGPGGKQVPPGRKLSDSVGRNDKTRVLLRLQAAGEGPPGREAPVSPAEQAAMLAFYRKKQAEAAALAAADGADSDSAAWADPRSLKASITGVTSLRLGGRGASGFNQGVM